MSRDKSEKGIFKEKGFINIKGEDVRVDHLI